MAAAELHTPETDREYTLCWRIFNHAPDHITKGELAEQMSSALKEHRGFRQRQMLNQTKEPA